MIRIKKHESRIKGYLLLFSMILASLFMIQPVYALTPCPATGGGVDIGGCFGFGNLKSLGETTSQLVTPAFSIAAAGVVIYFLLGAFKYLRSGGNKEEVEGARQMITHAIIGFIILMFAFLILQFLLSSLFEVTGLQIF